MIARPAQACYTGIMATRRDRARRGKWPVAFADTDGPESARRYWASRPASERVAAVTLLRRQYFVVRGIKRLPRLERVVAFRDRAA